MMENERLRNIIETSKLKEEYKNACVADKSLPVKLEKIIFEYAQNPKIPFMEKCEVNAKSLLMKVLEAKELKEIHSARARVKSVDSLIGKIIIRKADLSKEVSKIQDYEKYRNINEKNYDKIITDLAGIRILVRYPQQCRIVNKWVMDFFRNDPNSYVHDWEKDYSDSNDEFIVERPKIYLRSGQSAEDYMIPDYDKIFDVLESERGYSSIHYVVRYDRKYIEIQVRTIYDEAWGECTHDLVYKCKDPEKKDLLEKLSKCLAVQTDSAESLSKYMYEISNEENLRKEREELSNAKNVKEEKKHNTMEMLIRQAEKSNKKTDFDGNVDKL